MVNLVKTNKFVTDKLYKITFQIYIVVTMEIRIKYYMYYFDALGMKFGLSCLSSGREMVKFGEFHDVRLECTFSRSLTSTRDRIPCPDHHGFCFIESNF